MEMASGNIMVLLDQDCIPVGVNGLLVRKRDREMLEIREPHIDNLIKLSTYPEATGICSNTWQKVLGKRQLRTACKV